MSAIKIGRFICLKKQNSIFGRQILIVEQKIVKKNMKFENQFWICLALSQLWYWPILISSRFPSTWRAVFTTVNASSVKSLNHIRVQRRNACQIEDLQVAFPHSSNKVTTQSVWGSESWEWRIRSKGGWLKQANWEIGCRSSHTIWTGSTTILELPFLGKLSQRPLLDLSKQLSEKEK